MFCWIIMQFGLWQMDLMRKKAKVAAKITVESAIEYFMLRPRFNYDVIKEMMDYANLKVKENSKKLRNILLCILL